MCVSHQGIYIYVTPFFPSAKSWRGAIGYDFVRALQRVSGWTVVVLKEGDGVDYDFGGVHVYTFQSWRLPSNVFSNLFSVLNRRSFLKKVESVLCSDFRFEPSTCFDAIKVCHANTANYGVYALGIKAVNPTCKTLLQHHDLASFGLNMGRLRHCWLYNLIQFPILRRMHERIDTHVFISEASRKSFLAAPDTSWTLYADYKKQMRGLPYRSARINDSVILHNGVNKNIFSVKKICGSERRTHSAWVIGCIANFQVLKDHLTLLKAVKILRDTEQKNVHLILVGSGETLTMCKQFALTHGLDVEFRREVKHEELADFYHGLDLYVMPSRFEGFGCVYTEAHACGVPFIACEGQGMDDLIPAEDREKWLCKVGDENDLAEKIKRYMVERYSQNLNEDQNIDDLVASFVAKILGGAI